MSERIGGGVDERSHTRWWVLGIALAIGVVAWIFVSQGGVEEMETFADGITGHQAVRTGRELENEIRGIVRARDAQFEAVTGEE